MYNDRDTLMKVLDMYSADHRLSFSPGNSCMALR